MSNIQTIEVYSKKHGGDKVIINRKDFNPGIHSEKPFEKVATPTPRPKQTISTKKS